MILWFIIGREHNHIPIMNILGDGVEEWDVVYKHYINAEVNLTLGIQ